MPPSTEEVGDRSTGGGRDRCNGRGDMPPSAGEVRDRRPPSAGYNGGGDMPPSAGEVGDRRPPSAGFNGGGGMPPSAEDVGGRRPPSAEFNVASLSGLGMFLSRSSSSHLVSCLVSRFVRHISGGAISCTSESCRCLARSRTYRPIRLLSIQRRCRSRRRCPRIMAPAAPCRRLAAPRRRCPRASGSPCTLATAGSPKSCRRSCGSAA